MPRSLSPASVVVLSTAAVILMPVVAYGASKPDKSAATGGTSESVVASGQAASQPAGGSKSKVVSLYEQNQYEQAADAFEADSAHANATATYYAVLANMRCHRSLRAKQLAQYVLDRYPGSTEATLCEAVLRSSGGKVDPAKNESTGGNKSNVAATAAKSGGKIATDRSERGQYPRQLYTAEEIAKVGASGIDQTSKPNCWFEASLAALARLPRGQRMIAEMITQVDPQTYVVRFPNDGNEYKIDKAELKADKIHDTALWASLIDCAESKRYPHNQGMSSEKTWVETALACVCGGRVETTSTRTLSAAELSSFIGGAVSSNNPIVCSTPRLDSLPPIVFGGHAYTITEFDPSKGMITLRNPHGRYSKSFSRLPDDPQERHFKQLKGGYSQMDIETFQKYFQNVSRAFI